MRKIAVFGKPGSGKSTLSKHLASATGIQLHQLDSIVYKKNGDLVDRKTYDKEHGRILSTDSWIIDGFGPVASFNKRLDMADTLIYIDLPYAVSYWLVTKRLLKGLFVQPEGWPEGSASSGDRSLCLISSRSGLHNHAFIISNDGSNRRLDHSGKRNWWFMDCKTSIHVIRRCARK